MKTKIFGRFVLASVLILNFVLGGVSFGETSSTTLPGLSFSDVKQSDENFDAIYFLSNMGVIQGYHDEGSDASEYRPENDINRAEFLKLIIEGTNKAEFVQFSECFPDVPDSEWYAPYVCLAKENGWVSGYPDGTFKPGQTINEVEALKILGNVMDWQVALAAPGEDWYKPYLNYADDKNLLGDKGVGELMTRADIAEIVFRNVQVKTFGDVPYDKELVDDLYYYYNMPTDVLKDVQVALEANKDLGNTYQIYTDWFKNLEDPTWYGDIVVSTNDNDSNYEDYVTPYVDDGSGITISQTYPITAGYKATDNIEIQVYDKDGSPLEGRSIELYASTGIDYSEKIDVIEYGNGIYYGSFSSTLAGEYKLFATDVKSGVTGEGYLDIEPGLLADAKIIDVIEPFESEDINKAIVKVVGEDEYGNTVPYYWNSNDLGIVTSLGKVTKSSNDGSIFMFEITADSWGTANISVVDNNEKVSFDEAISVNFLPLQLVHSKGIEYEKGAEIEIPIYVYFPSKMGELGSYELELNYDPALFDFVEGKNLEIKSDEKNGVLYVYGGSGDLEINKTGSLVFMALTSGIGEFYADSFVLKDGAGKAITFISFFTADDLVNLFKWFLKIKFTDEICIEAFIFPGNTATQARIQTDIDKANAIFKQSGDNCNCSFYLHFSLKTTTNLSQDQWDAIDADSDDELDNNETEDMRQTYPPADEDCVPVYYIPRLTNGYLGLCWTDPATQLDGVSIDDQADFDDRTLAHELMHYISDNAIVDPTKPGSADQGANTANNIMNYDNTGDDMTVKQCEILDGKLDISVWR